MGTINDKINYLTETKLLIKNALISKGIVVSDEDTFRSYVQKIIDYNGIDTSDATATADDIVEGTSAYVKGKKVEGTIKKLDNININQFDIEDTTWYGRPNYLVAKGVTYSPTTIFKERITTATVPMSYDYIASVIGLTADKIKNGETVLGIAGTYNGIDTSDATATAGDIINGKSAYINGEKVEGTINTFSDVLSAGVNEIREDTESGLIYIDGDAGITNRICLEKTSTITMVTDSSELASSINLTADKIKNGETVLGITGTYNGIDTSDATATANDIIKNKTAYVNGEKVTGQLEIEPDWSQIGYSKAPQYIIDNVNYTKTLYDEWNSQNTTAKNLYKEDNKLVYAPNIDTSNVTDMESMFNSCSQLTDIPSLNTSNVTNMYYMCVYCNQLKSVGKLDAQKVININYFIGSSSVLLTTLGGFENLGKAYTTKSVNKAEYNLKLSYSSNLTLDSIMNVINNLYDLNNKVTDGTWDKVYAQSLILGTTNLSKLTDEEKAIAISKGWSLS